MQFFRLISHTMGNPPDYMIRAINLMDMENPAIIDIQPESTKLPEVVIQIREPEPESESDLVMGPWEQMALNL